MHGCAAAIASTANVVPRLVVNIVGSVSRGDMKGAVAGQFLLHRLRRLFDLGTFPVVVKEAMQLIGIPVGSAAAPTLPLTEDAKGQLAVVVAEIAEHLAR